ncbi:hypothetical protein Vadar_014150 [Vaccinium darrowii]|uniref:Uncharacterized protein n=1 Tax=Vaccinium darrowii TaxID=229202 RepID=A0ACB7Y6H0_9ERIC|nr:hypothetical protein Vadar_014150 [Vaccinium darrowii]
MGELNDRLKPRSTVFVTAETTCFDAFGQAVDTTEVKEELFWIGYLDLLIQIGRGSYLPIKYRGEYGSLQVDQFTFSSSIADNMRSDSRGAMSARLSQIMLIIHGSPLLLLTGELAALWWLGELSVLWKCGENECKAVAVGAQLTIVKRFRTSDTTREFRRHCVVDLKSLKATILMIPFANWDETDGETLFRRLEGLGVPSSLVDFIPISDQYHEDSYNQ